MKKLTILGISLLLLVLLSALLHVQGQESLYIAFVSDRTGVENIYLIRNDGSNLINLTQSRYRDWNPAWSPDGRQIAFNSLRDDNAEIYIIGLNGSGQRNLTNNVSGDYSPAWSPDGSRIAFVSDRNGGADLYVLTLASNEIERLTQDGTAKDHPTWSPDGRALAYWQNTGTAVEIRRFDLPSGTISTLVSEGTNDWPAWSPDGSRIAFHRLADNSGKLFTVSSEGGTIQPLPDGAGNELRPAWSPDGQELAYMSDRDGNFEIYTESPRDGLARRITDNASVDHSPVWQPRPVEVDLGGGASQQQNFSIISANAATGSEQAGEGEARLFAPERVGEDDLILVRLEVQATNLIASDVLIPTSTPYLSTLPTPTALPLVDIQFAQVFTIMGAELRGVDIGNFIIDPAPSNYVLRLDPNIVNYWEWYLRPITPAAFQTNFLSVALYVPERQEDGSIAITTVNRFNFEITVEQSTSLAPSPEPTPEPAQPLFTISFTEPNAFIIINQSDTDLSNVSFTAAGSTLEFLFREDWPEFLAEDFRQGDCFAYLNADEEAPAYPRSCQRITERVLNIVDVFWFDTSFNRPNTVIVRYNGRVFSCSESSVACPINPQNLPDLGEQP